VGGDQISYRAARHGERDDIGIGERLADRQHRSATRALPRRAP